jgi:two-component system, chemotaxis family, protein-glutamate methylesterase/glutaminase
VAEPASVPGMKVVVVDDSSFMRSVIKHIIAGAPGFTVVGEAADGRLGLDVIARERPDIVTLDVEMPNLDGLGVLRALGTSPTARPLVIMVSAHTAEGARITMDALRAGAFDFVPKASEQAKMDLAQISVLLGQKLVQCRTALALGRQPQPQPQPQPLPQPQPGASALSAPSVRRDTVPVAARVVPPPLAAAVRVASDIGATAPGRTNPGGATVGAAAMGSVSLGGGDRPDLVVVGISTGGPHTLPLLLAPLTGYSAPIVIAQHIPEVFSRSLAAMLAESTGGSIREGLAGEVLEPSTVYILRGGTDTEVHRQSDGRLALRPVTGEAYPYHPSADALFRSAALAARRPVGVIMTGMGDDGVEGARLLIARGRPVIVQDPATCVISGMPQAALSAGLKVDVLAPAAIAARLLAMAPTG